MLGSWPDSEKAYKEKGARSVLLIKFCQIEYSSQIVTFTEAAEGRGSRQLAGHREGVQGEGRQVSCTKLTSLYSLGHVGPQVAKGCCSKQMAAQRMA